MIYRHQENRPKKETLMNTDEKNNQSEKPGIVHTILRILLGIFLIFAGVNHLTFARAEFLAQVPPWVPLDGDLVVVLL